MTEAAIRENPRMASVKDMPLLKDGPPHASFGPIRYARRIPSKGPSAVAIFLAAFGAFSWGMYPVGKCNKIRREPRQPGRTNSFMKVADITCLTCGDARNITKCSQSRCRRPGYFKFEGSHKCW